MCQAHRPTCLEHLEYPSHAFTPGRARASPSGALGADSAPGLPELFTAAQGLTQDLGCRSLIGFMSTG